MAQTSKDTGNRPLCSGNRAFNELVSRSETRSGNVGARPETHTARPARLFIPLFPTEGGPARGFLCGTLGCGRVTRTMIGLKRHLWRKHHIRPQLDLFT
jgi:hypothetical protein